MTTTQRAIMFGLILAGIGIGAPAVGQPDLAGGAARAPTLAGQPGPKSVRLARLASLLGKDGEIRIIAFGSSSTQGTGASSPAHTYPALLKIDLEARLRAAGSDQRAVTVINRGRGGDDSEAMAKRLARDVLAEQPDLVVWQTGSNDPLRGVPVERFVELTRQGIEAIRATGSDVVLMDQQWCRRLSNVEETVRYTQAMHALAAELGVPVIRRHDMMRSWVADGLMTPAQMIGPDGLHMTDAGYSQLAKAISTQLLLGAGFDRQALARN